MRPLLCLCMMVRDEAKTIRKTIESVRHVIDRWVVLDTGSTDGTQDIVRDAFGKMPGQLYEEPFVDYATTRNRVLDLADCVDPPLFTLMLSADETVENPKYLAQFLEEMKDAPDGAYCVTMVNGTQQWPYTRVLRTDAKWRYQGTIQEHPVGPNGEVDAAVIPNVRVVFRESDLARKQKRLREVDLPLLTKIAEDTSKPYDERARAMYYLGDTHAMLAADMPRGADGRPDPRSAWFTHNMMAMSYYWRYVLIADDEKNTVTDRAKASRAHFLYYHIADKMGFYAPTELAVRLEALTHIAPKLAEARWLLAEVSAQVDVRQGLFHALEAAKVAREVLANPPPHEAIDTRVEWLSLRLAAACAKQMGQGTQATDLAKRGLAAGGPVEAFEGFGVEATL